MFKKTTIFWTPRLMREIEAMSPQARYECLGARRISELQVELWKLYLGGRVDDPLAEWLQAPCFRRGSGERGWIIEWLRHTHRLEIHVSHSASPSHWTVKITCHGTDAENKKFMNKIECCVDLKTGVMGMISLSC